MTFRIWLFENYGPVDSRVAANMKMDNFTMRQNQSVQDFTNMFELILQDVLWAASMEAVCSAYRKLLRGILERIHNSTFGCPPLTFSEYKRAAQDAKNHLKM